eukprot:g63248.t1
MGKQGRIVSTNETYLRTKHHVSCSLQGWWSNACTLMDARKNKTKKPDNAEPNHNFTILQDHNATQIYPHNLKLLSPNSLDSFPNCPIVIHVQTILVDNVFLGASQCFDRATSENERRVMIWPARMVTNKPGLQLKKAAGAMVMPGYGFLTE